MAAGKFQASKFRVRLESDDGDQRVTVVVGMDGLKIMNEAGTMTMRSLDLKHISRWSTIGAGTLVIYTQTPVDLEERQLLLSGDTSTIQSLLDTLTCNCMQLAELLQSGRGAGDLDAGNHLGGLVAGGGRKKAVSPSLPSADSVEYWHGAEKGGWLHSQGDVVKTWRKRWIVLKQGYLFRFMGPDVSERDRPRGVVDLSQVQDVRDGRGATGRTNSIQLLTGKGASVCFLCDTETEMVEWISAIEGAIARIVKTLAGVEEEARSGRGGSGKASSGKAGGAADWAKQMERAIERGAGGGGGGGGGGARRGGGSQMVDVVDYGGSTNGRGGGGSAYSSSGYGGGGGGGYGGSSGYGGGYKGGGGYGGDRDGGISNYSQISGIAGVAGGAPADDLALNYGMGAAGGGGGGGDPYGSSRPYDPYSSGGPAAGGYGGGSAGYGAPAPAPSASYGAPAPAYGGDPYGQAYSQPAAAPTTSSYDAGGYGYYGQQQPTQQQQAAPAGAPPVSLIDLVPHQQPAYPSYHQAGGGSGGASAPPERQPSATTWQVLHTPEGRPYYFNPTTNVTQWEAPPGY